MLLVLAAPSVNDPYYRPAFQEIVDFQIGYAKAIEGKDEVVLLVDKATMPYYENRLPPQVLLQAEIADIWMRDFTTVDPIDPVEFVYTSASTQKAIDDATDKMLTKLHCWGGLDDQGKQYEQVQMPCN